MDERGSSPVEFVLVGALLTVLTLAVLQLGLAVYVRNVVHDAAVEGAYHAALADTSLRDGAARTTAIIARTVGDAFVQQVTAQEIPGQEGARGGQPVIAVTVTATLPLVGLLGMIGGLEVTGHAPAESLD
ncbi:TadE/TadG family type IV pilus assembly protein [uncultured Microbacterium sp.]|uniref:TadE family protein n=1 Tax=uncultured Microbacterium sp. TaxID=191216 RepID=A0A1Y5P385_9MICO|nr:TadE/TadG family type IV pilus assembly protein [uncultured Microbacterium sp.]SBS70408.1 TadE family protein [uncultured Microbacterium sp.]